MTSDIDEAAERVLITAAARAYVAAKVRLEGADAANLLAAAVELDIAWHELHLACGVPWGGSGCEDAYTHEVERDTRSGRTVRSEKPL